MCIFGGSAPKVDDSAARERAARLAAQRDQEAKEAGDRAKQAQAKATGRRALLSSVTGAVGVEDGVGSNPNSLF